MEVELIDNSRRAVSDALEEVFADGAEARVDEASITQLLDFHSHLLSTTDAQRLCEIIFLAAEQEIARQTR